MLHDWERQHPGRVENVFRSLQNVTLSHLADPLAFDFASLGSRPDAPRLSAVEWLIESSAD
jgi:tRNA 2-thiocytidine biosynthesis protein TtcA